MVGPPACLAEASSAGHLPTRPPARLPSPPLACPSACLAGAACPCSALRSCAHGPPSPAPPWAWAPHPHQPRPHARAHTPTSRHHICRQTTHCCWTPCAAGPGGLLPASAAGVGGGAHARAWQRQPPAAAGRRAAAHAGRQGRVVGWWWWWWRGQGRGQKRNPCPCTSACTGGAGAAPTPGLVRPCGWPDTAAPPATFPCWPQRRLDPGMGCL